VPLAIQELDIKGLALGIINNISVRDRFIKLKIVVKETTLN
jgi:hypothetical protein